MEDIL